MLGCMEIAHLVLKETVKLFSREAMPFPTPSAIMMDLFSLSVHQLLMTSSFPF